MFDGWLFFFRDAKDMTPDAVGRLCVVRLAGVDGMRLRWVQRGYHEGHWTLTGLCFGPQGAGNDGIEEGRIISAAPILWMRQ